jgi:hypothetical protein
MDLSSPRIHQSPCAASRHVDAGHCRRCPSTMYVVTIMLKGCLGFFVASFVAVSQLYGCRCKGASVGRTFRLQRSGQNERSMSLSLDMSPPCFCVNGIRCRVFLANHLHLGIVISIRRSVENAAPLALRGTITTKHRTFTSRLFAPNATGIPWEGYDLPIRGVNRLFTAIWWQTVSYVWGSCYTAPFQPQRQPRETAASSEASGHFFRRKKQREL